MSTDRGHRHTFVLIPGAGGQASYWDWVTPLLEAAGHDVVPVDLPAGDAAAGIAEYVDATIAAIGGRETPILVAQSLGGFTAVGVCSRMPVAQLVFVNAMIPAPGETSGEWWSNTGQAEAMRANTIADGRDPDKEFDLMETFFHDVPSDVTAQVMAGPEPQQTDTPFGSPSVFEHWPQVPIRAIIGREDRLFPLEFQRRIVRERLGIAADEITGGHVVALANPEGLARLLVGYADEL